MAEKKDFSKRVETRSKISILRIRLVATEQWPNKIVENQHPGIPPSPKAIYGEGRRENFCVKNGKLLRL